MSLPPLPAQPADTPWPTREWPLGDIPASADHGHIAAALDHAFADTTPADLGDTHALVIIHRGRLVLERYAPDFGPDVTNPSWSMAKSITHALVGLAVLDGRLDIYAPADVPQWRTPGDPRAAITLDQLLRMSSGLAFLEKYIPGEPSDVIEMLFGAGKADMAAFAAGFPLAHSPGTFCDYSSGTTNIICGVLARALDRRGEDFAAFMRERLFEPLGMTSADPKFDGAGAFIGSSFCFATTRDFARFGLLYLRDGIWEGRRLLPRGWVDYARTPTWLQPGADIEGGYGAHWWLDHAGPGSFSANGHQSQYIFVVPQKDLILARNGATPSANEGNVKAWLRALGEAF